MNNTASKKLSSTEITAFQKFIFSWWETNRRDLPWRHTHDPYEILVSELMLQQTQVLRVIPKYHEFIERFPTVFDLSHASTSDVLILWKGMGYNRRALYLKKLAEIVVDKYQGVFPDDEKKLKELPGLGNYTARAVLVFALKKDVAMIDTNIRQIIVHHFFHDEPQKEARIQEVADQLVPVGKSWEWHQALMDYGSIEMKKFFLFDTTGRRQPRLTRVRVGRKASIPFRDTNRFSRGRLMDLLREKDWAEELLMNEMKKRYKKDPDYIHMILEGLLKDGLIERSKNDIISLPK